MNQFASPLRAPALRSLAALGAVLLSAGATPAAAQRDFSETRIEARAVSDGLYMLTGAGGNMALSTGEDGAFLIDDQYAPLSDKIMAAIRDVTDDEVAFVVNTHWHGDHTGGNEAFGAAGAHLVAHDNVRKRLKEGLRRPGGSTTPPAAAAALPVVTFSDALTFHWNGDEIRVWHPEPAHTDGDAVVHFVRANAVHMGDIFFNGAYPYIDLDSGGDLDGYIAAQQAVLARIDTDTTIIPGHGPLADAGDLEAALAMLKEVRARIAPLAAEGVGVEAAVAADPLADLNEKWGQGFIDGDRMVRSAYRSLSR